MATHLWSIPPGLRQPPPRERTASLQSVLQYGTMRGAWMAACHLTSAAAKRIKETGAWDLPVHDFDAGTIETEVEALSADINAANQLMETVTETWQCVLRTTP